MFLYSFLDNFNFFEILLQLVLRIKEAILITKLRYIRY